MKKYRRSGGLIKCAVFGKVFKLISCLGRYMKKNKLNPVLLLIFVFLFSVLLIAEKQQDVQKKNTKSTIVLKNGDVVGLGCIKETSLPDWIKRSTPKFTGDYKSSIDLSENFPPIDNQGGQGSCTAWATAYYYKTYQEWVEHGWNVNDADNLFSPAFVYNQINGGEDKGSMISDAFKLFEDLGCCSWEDMPYTDMNYTNLPGEDEYTMGIPFRTEETHAIYFDNGVNELKTHLLSNDCAVIGISVYPNFDNIGNYNNTYCVNDVYGDIRGGHAVCVCGYDDNRVTSDGTGAFKVANSWGPSFGESGYFWMSYEAMQSSTLCHGYAYYSIDKIDYEAQLVSKFNISYDDRAALSTSFGIGNNDNPVWSKNFFNWSLRKMVGQPFPTENVVIDLTDGLNFLDLPPNNQVFLKTKDRRFFWHRSMQHAYSGKSWWCADEDLPGYDNGWLMFLDTPEITLGTGDCNLTFMLSYAIEDPGSSDGYDGWDAANVRISTNGFQTYSVLNGSPAYDFSSGYGWGYNDEGTNIPGWGGFHPQWQEASFDLSAYAGETVQIRIAFGSDPGWCSADNSAYFGLLIDDITVTSGGNVVYYDDAEGEKSHGSVNYFEVTNVLTGFTEICAELPVPVPESGEYVFSNVQFMDSSFMVGDINQDEDINIADIVMIVNFLVGIDEPDNYQLWAADINKDGIVNVLDIVTIVNILLYN